MFYCKDSHRKTEQKQKRGIRIVLNESHISLEELLNRDQDISVHCKHIKTLLTKICKFFQRKILIL